MVDKKMIEDKLTLKELEFRQWLAERIELAKKFNKELNTMKYKAEIINFSEVLEQFDKHYHINGE